MARTKRNRNKKQKYLGETKRKGRGLFDSKFFTMLLSENAKAKAKYEKRLKDAYALNQQLLAEQQEALIKLEKQGVDGPHNRTRSKTKMAKRTQKYDPVLFKLEHPELSKLEQLYNDRIYTQQALEWNEYLLKKLRDGKPEDYKKLLTQPQPNWDINRMAPKPRTYAVRPFPVAGPF